MKRAGNLYPQVTDFSNLYHAFKRAFKGANKTNESLSFYFHMENELLSLKEQLIDKTYKPGSYRYFKVHDPKERVIAVAPFRDRVVHHAVVHVLEPIYERFFIHDSYATRKDKGTHKAIIRAQEFMRGERWFLKMDIEKYFDNVDHDILIGLLNRKIKDRDILKLLEDIIRNGGAAGKGLPIGNLTSQFLANVYLDPFDHYVKEKLGVGHYIRYMDDFVTFSSEKEDLKEQLELMDSFLSEKLKLRLKEKAVLINQRKHGLSFLGARVFPGVIRIQSNSLRRCMKKLRKKFEDNKEGRLL